MQLVKQSLLSGYFNTDESALGGLGRHRKQEPSFVHNLCDVGEMEKHLAHEHLR